MASPKRVTVENVMNAAMYDCIQQPPLATARNINSNIHNNTSFPQRPYSDESSSAASSEDNGDYPSDFTSSRPKHQNGNGNGFQHFEVEQDDNDRIRRDSNKNSSRDDRPSNENLLGTAFVTFMGFALVQTVVAVFAKSEAMLGDSAAMIVDALTYLFNYVAENKKKQFDELEQISVPHMEYQNNEEVRQRILHRTKRKMVLKLELLPPCISVSTLIAVTAVVLHKAIRILVLDSHRSKSLQGNPNIHVMMYFSIANLLLDIVNVANFAKAKHMFGYETHEHPDVDVHEHTAIQQQADDDDDDIDNEEGRTSVNDQLQRRQSTSSDDEYDQDQDHTANLNMCSAYTHVFADTLRSIAVLIAAMLSELVEPITPEEADAAAAVVVSGLILLSLIPLFQGLVQTFHELRMIRAEEKSDELLFTTS